MEKLSQSIENLKLIYLQEVQKEFSCGLNQELNTVSTVSGFDKVPFWKIVADKFIFVIHKKSPELSGVVAVIIQEVLEIIEQGKHEMKNNFEVERNKLLQEIDLIKSNFDKAEKDAKLYRDEIEKLKADVRDSQIFIENLTRSERQSGQPCPADSSEIRNGRENFESSLRNCDINDPKEAIETKDDTLANLSNMVSSIDLNPSSSSCISCQTFKTQVASLSEKLSISNASLSKLQQENQDLFFRNNELQIEIDDLRLKSKPIERNTLPPKTDLSKLQQPSPLFKPGLKPNPSKSMKEIKESKEVPRKTLIKPRTTNNHDMTVRQLKETIEDIYFNKGKFDEKCRDSRMPRETMDQFLYTYLNQKYGLKSLISEWSVLILRAIDKHESSDAEVALFSKVLNHRVDEDYRQVFEKLKENMKQFLKAKIQQNNPYMRESQVNSIVKEKVVGVLDEDEWATIIVSMFSSQEAEFMVGSFKTLLEENIGKLVLARKTKFNVAKGEASFVELMNFILNHDLSAREALLFPFFQNFTEEDFDKNGILSAEEFRMLCVRLGVDGDYPRLVLQVDPYSSGFINFSDCVTLFTYEMVALEDESPISVIHYLYFHSKGSS